MSSIVAKEVSGLIGAYIRAWVYGGLVGAGITLYAMAGSAPGLHQQPQSCSFSPTELPCMTEECLTAFGYTLQE